MENPDLLNQRINFLKSNIQEIIDKCSSSNDVEFIDALNDKKNEYMTELEKAVKELKLSKDKNRRDNEYKKVMRANDSLEYHRVKNKSNSTELLSELKKKREKAQNDFEKMVEIEKDYMEKEESMCSELPGFLFFHKDIIDMYGSCPYIMMDDNVKDNRLNWLDNQEDNGQLYRYLYDKYILKVEHNILLKQKEDMETYFIELHKDYLSDSQHNLLIDSEEYLKDYINSSVKTKKIKDKFKIIVNNISNIVIETGLNINEYISSFYGVYIPVNIKRNNDMLITEQGEFIATIYNDKVTEYKQLIESIETSTRFLNNSTNNLKQELYQYIYNQSYVKKTIKSQQGKYFKKWSQLTDEEKLDRYNCFIEFFIIKYLVEPDLITGDEINNTIDSVKTLIKDNMQQIKFKDIKWNIKRGVVEQIFPLKFKEEDKSFYLVQEKEKEKEKDKIKPKKPSSVRTLINKETEKVINEELVMYILHLKKNKKLKADNIKTIKDEFVERLKIKLRVKRVTVNDKIEVFKKFDDIYNVIANNDSSSSG
jgi:hypothetical protein